jgi:hypothetical protein
VTFVLAVAVARLPWGSVVFGLNVCAPPPLNVVVRLAGVVMNALAPCVYVPLPKS